MLEENCILSCKCCRRLLFSTFHLSVTSSIPAYFTQDGEVGYSKPLKSRVAGG